MAYTKTVWVTGDVITAAKLNNAEDGIEAAQGFVITGEWVAAEPSEYPPQAAGAYKIVMEGFTYEDVNDAMKSGRNIVLNLPAIETHLPDGILCTVSLPFTVSDGYVVNNAFTFDYEITPIGTALTDTVEIMLLYFGGSGT